jgi:C4-dicarboxylate transporter/malic acid transport protein
MVTAVQPLVLRRAPSVRHLGPNWYAAVMGTTIVATAGSGLPEHVPGVRSACTVVWAVGLAALVVLFGARAAHWTHHRDQARAHLLDPMMAPFYGCLAMAMLAVGAASLAVGQDWIGLHAAIALDSVLFTAGTLTGLASALVVPYLMVVRHRIEPGQASPVWLLAIVPPMVSAACGPALVPHLPPGQLQQTLLLACFAMYGISLLMTLTMLPTIFARLVTGGPLPLAMTPSLLLVLGPLGQSVTATGAIADAAHGALRAPYASGLADFAILYGVPVIGFALLWFAFALAQVGRALRGGMRFSMGWWAFTFPVGTCTTGAESLARHTGLDVFQWLAVALYVFLVVAVVTAAVGTLRGLFNGSVLAAPRQAAAAPQPVTVRTTSDAVR